MDVPTTFLHNVYIVYLLRKIEFILVIFRLIIPDIQIEGTYVEDSGHGCS
jgi:hypothetical protein